ncbi:MAG TPA: 1-deoxy-D-xylulose-5-phosphate synthase [Feifaniaceae bacterium]|nr:1-deoxy-D-xylulose-5-phosphate synthase [Feifaniaceae bacterium]
MDRYPILDTINSPEDVKKLPEAQLPILAAQIRQYMIENVARCGGHLASSLGAVELTIAMHRAFSSPVDEIVFDVGHQSYAHKILTGRREAFCTLRQENGISGFPKREESEHDPFNTGHASTAISAALGIARAKRLLGLEGAAVALVGDGALTGGLAFEGLNDAGQADVPLVVILNDNEMSISQNVGALHRMLVNMRVSPGYVRFKRFLVRVLDTGMIGRWLSRHMENLKNRIKSFLMPKRLFEDMGFLYLGPIDGHDIHALTRMFKRAREMKVPVIVHCVTQKGKGYAFSERNPEKFHGVAPFSIDTGDIEPMLKKSNSSVFGGAMIELAEKDPKIVAVSAAMPIGTGLAEFATRFPDRFFDVGIAEEHALTMAAGMAAGGLKPVVAIYSTFLQRGYDQILHDICLQNLPVVLAIDRAGLVGEDGETHQGVYDASFLFDMPNITIYSPATQQELVHMLKLAVERGEPAAVRYPRGSLIQAVSSVPVERGKWEVIEPIAEKTVIATGAMVALAMPVARKLGAGLVNARTFRPMDDELLETIQKTAKFVVVMEEGVDCLGLAVTAAVAPVKVERMNVSCAPVTHASVSSQRERCGLTAAALEQRLTGKAK